LFDARVCQLPCLHDGLNPRDGRWRRLASWYAAMDSIPPYVCRVKGSAASWRKTLSSAPWWPAGWKPPKLVADAQAGSQADAQGSGLQADAQAEARATAADGVDALDATWRAYARGRPAVAPTPAREAAARIVRNRHAIVRDAQRRRSVYGTCPFMHDTPPDEIDAALRAFVVLLSEPTAAKEARARSTPGVAAVAAYLDERLCVPRDMGAPPAAQIHQWRRRLESEDAAIEVKM
jgi:glutathione S-transferase